MEKTLKIFLSLLIFSICMGGAGVSVVQAAPGSCVTDASGVVTCTGNQSQGIAGGKDFSTPPATALDVNSLTGAVTPAFGTPGITFTNSSGSGITVKSGTALDPVVITTQGSYAEGIKAVSSGSPSGTMFLPGLGITVPSGTAGGAGPVSVESYSTITTGGAYSHGISAQNAIGTYNATVVSSLQSFSMNSITISLSSVSGAGGNIGKAVAGDQGGLFTLKSNGTWLFDAGALATSLAKGQSVITTIEYQVLISSSSGTTSSSGSLAVCVTKDENGAITASPAVYFPDFGVYSDTSGATPLWPNLQGYVNNLLADMGIGAAGESLAVTNAGSITTYGSSAYGIYSRAEGGKGATGQSGSFWVAWLVPTAGGKGSNGGSINIVHDGSIHTAGNASGGMVVESQGGVGGNGGNGSLWQQNGAQGGTGGAGGDIHIGGDGSIYTTGDSASGILAQSAGGSGGVGGAGNTAGVGGAGGFGGKGGAVTVDGDWFITTLGAMSHGIWAKSLGGSAGAGGSGGWLVSRPGSGGEAADGGAVTVRSGGSIDTRGDYAYGIYAQSIGGAGGTGASSFGLLWSYGGDGGSAGSGAAVSVTHDIGGTITTRGIGSYGIAAQSIGGGGGIGSDSTSLIVSVGGAGGAGGLGGAVSVVNGGSIRTYGEDARGIFAQSIGGGGGDTGASYFGLISVGGLGQDASDGGSVTIQNTGSIATEAKSADAIYAESVGGGGGSGRSNFGAITLGGLGTGGGAGGAVTVTSSGNISTAGDGSRGIYAHSIGGGGGTGRGAYGIVAVGGLGAGSGAGGAVSVENAGTITTLGAFSDAVYAQSVGGGGGSGLADRLAEITLGLVSVGGTGVGGGNGGSVTVKNLGTIQTKEKYSRGIFAQSIGGGGGTANVTSSNIFMIGGSGGAAGHGGQVSVENGDIIATQGLGSHGIEAQSVGGGGGSSGYNFSLAVNIGGANGSSGNGGNVTVKSTGNISTKGDAARGIIAQSIGGSGGSFLTKDQAFDWENVSFDVGLLFSIGSQSAASGSGGVVSVTNTGTITTEGLLSDAIYAQSVGGGGGNGSLIIGAVALEVGMSIGDESSGHGGAVTVTNEGNIGTAGISSNGIYAQSVGGGGGDGRYSLGLLSFTYDTKVGAGGTGTGGAVTVTNTGNIDTAGSMSRGIFAQSIGGAGGNGTSVLAASMGLELNSCVAIGGDGGAGGAGGVVTVDNSGYITTLGSEADGIFAQSIGGGGGNGGNSIAVTAAIGIVDFFSGSSAQSVGGSSGGGGAGGKVAVINSGTIITGGNQANAVFAQSVGGGGGNGGAGLVGAMTVNTDQKLTSAVGGAGGAGGVGGVVTVDGSGIITTAGDQASGILAQSVGGGGGRGGTSALITMDKSIPLPSIEELDQIPTLNLSNSISSSIGGTGGEGGVGGSVSVCVAGDIVTQGELSYGIQAQSIGGGGGIGGNSMIVNSSVKILSAEIPTEWSDLIDLPSVATNVSVSVGGTGGTGGAGGAVTVTSEGDIGTEGSMAYGIYAQSVGGGGGDGGSSVTFSEKQEIGTLSVSIAPEVEVKYASSVGGTGGTGGAGGAVTVTSEGGIGTQGEMACGIFAQSIGGGGGNGASSITTVNKENILTLGTAAKLDIGYVSSIGGTGGTGGTGGAVSVKNDGWIETAGAYAYGIFAQSIGGGGGAGGASITAGVEQSVLTASPLAINVGYEESVGGAGTAGGAGGAVTVANSGYIATAGASAAGIFAQSIGGGGGAGGASITTGMKQNILTGTLPAFSVRHSSSIGGAGSAGGEGSAVTVENSGYILTQGGLSDGVFAQSVGGGGGAGGASIKTGTEQTIVNVPLPALDVSYTSSIGGTGAAGGAGGNVTITHTGEIATAGDYANGLFAQSIGGGGGRGGAIISADTKLTVLNYAQIKVGVGFTESIGGSSSTGGAGGNVIITSLGPIVTTGEYSNGIFAQSIGGGGGSGGANISVTTSTSVLNQTIEAGYAGRLVSDIGGSGGAGGAGGNVSVENGGTIYTAGAFSSGLLAQSIGGGGGTGGIRLNIGAELDILTDKQNVNFGDETELTATIGGSGGSGGAGGVVTVDNTANIVTEGEFSSGITAQSVGGGGGLGGYQITADATVAGALIISNLDAKLTGNSGSPGDGSQVTVTHSGMIGTLGAFSHGIFAQSIGGGGGVAGVLNAKGLTQTVFSEARKGTLTNIDGLGVYFAGSVGGQGKGGGVTVSNSGDIITLGDYAHGIFAQSAGGTGAGDVSVTTGGSILAYGADASGIRAQSAGGTGNGNITISIQDGFVMGGTGSGAAISILDGLANTVTNYGTLLSAGGPTGNAIISTEGNETVNNYGLIAGTVDLGAGTNTFNNMPAGVFASGATINLGDGNTLTNAGLLSPGGSETYQITSLTGNYVQTASGALAMRVGFDGSQDKLLVGGSALIDGTLSVYKDQSGYAYKNGAVYTMLKASDVGGTFSTVNLPEAKPMLYFVVNQTDDAVEVQAVVPKASSVATNKTDRFIADYLDAILPGASGDLSRILSEFQNLSASQFGQAYASMSPASYDLFTRMSFTAIRQYIESLQRRMNMARLYANAESQDRLSKPVVLAMAGSNEDLVRLMAAGRTAESPEKNGLWLQGYRHWGDQKEKDGFPGYDYRVSGGAVGYDYVFPTNIMLGLSVNLAVTDIDLEQRADRGYVDNLTAAIYGSYFSKNAYLEGALSYGRNRYQNYRYLTIGSIERTAVSEHEADVYSAYAGGGYFFSFGNGSFGPVASLRYVYLNEAAFTERGADSMNLVVDRRKTQSLVSELGLRTAYTFKTPFGSLIPEASASLLYDFGIDDRMITVSFAGSPDLSFSMEGQDVDRLGAAVDAGLTFMTREGISTSLKYNGEFRDGYRSHGIMGQLRFVF